MGAEVSSDEEAPIGAYPASLGSWSGDSIELEPD